MNIGDYRIRLSEQFEPDLQMQRCPDYWVSPLEPRYKKIKACEFEIIRTKVLSRYIPKCRVRIVEQVPSHETKCTKQNIVNGFANIGC